MIKAVIFDMGGVVCNQMGADEIYDYLSTKLHVKKEEILEVVADLEEKFQKNEITKTEFVSSLFLRLGKKFKPEFKRFYVEGYIQGSPINHEIIDLIERLKSNSYKVGMITNTIDEHYNVHEKRGDYKYFEYVAASNKLKMRKPDKEIYLHTLKKMNLRAQEALFIDDKIDNVRAAEKLGMEAILAKSPKQVVADVEKIIKIKELSLKP